MLTKSEEADRVSEINSEEKLDNPGLNEVKSEDLLLVKDNKCVKFLDSVHLIEGKKDFQYSLNTLNIGYLAITSDGAARLMNHRDEQYGSYVSAVLYILDQCLSTKTTIVDDVSNIIAEYWYDASPHILRMFFDAEHGDLTYMEMVSQDEQLPVVVLGANEEKGTFSKTETVYMSYDTYSKVMHFEDGIGYYLWREYVLVMNKWGVTDLYVEITCDIHHLPKVELIPDYRVKRWPLEKKESGGEIVDTIGSGDDDDSEDEDQEEVYVDVNSGVQLVELEDFISTPMIQSTKTSEGRLLAAQWACKMTGGEQRLGNARTDGYDEYVFGDAPEIYHLLTEVAERTKTHCPILELYETDEEMHYAGEDMKYPPKWIVAMRQIDRARLFVSMSKSEWGKKSDDIIKFVMNQILVRWLPAGIMRSVERTEHAEELILWEDINGRLKRVGR